MDKDRPRREVAPEVQKERVAEPAAPARAGRWWSPYALRILITDAVAIYVAVFTAYLVRFDANGATRVNGRMSPSYLVVSVALLWAWLFALIVGRTEDRRIVGSGPAEYQRVVSASWRLFAWVAVFAYLLRMEIARAYLAIAFPLGLALILLGRYAWRRWLRRRRRQGELLSRVLVIGHRRKAEALVRQITNNPNAGFGAVGVCVPDGDFDPDETVLGVPVLGRFESAAQVARAVRADAVAVSGSDTITADAVRQLGWDLEGTGIDLALAVALTDVAGPRVLMQPVSDLPLVYVDEPHFYGPKYVLKTSFDWVGAALLTLILSPVLLVTAIAVKATSPGPVFYRQSRIGLDGTTFDMIKFRSMEANAEARFDEVMGPDVGMFYKAKADPRVTPLGRVIRRFSVDELPQLLNVLRGEMSLVGPRPQIAREVALYDRKATRRLLVKPGLTGLWQISGRSELTPEDGIRMDVYYVENWTLFGDLLLLARTVKAVLAGKGAY